MTLWQYIPFFDPAKISKTIPRSAVPKLCHKLLTSLINPLQILNNNPPHQQPLLSLKSTPPKKTGKTSSLGSSGPVFSPVLHFSILFLNGNNHAEEVCLTCPGSLTPIYRQTKKWQTDMWKVQYPHSLRGACDRDLDIRWWKWLYRT